MSDSAKDSPSPSPSSAALSVEQARAELVRVIVENSAEVRCDGSFPTIIPKPQIDALILAVQSEQRRVCQYPDDCPCDDEKPNPCPKCGARV